VAGVKCTRIGGAGGMPVRADVTALLAEGWSMSGACALAAKAAIRGPTGHRAAALAQAPKVPTDRRILRDRLTA